MATVAGGARIFAPAPEVVVTQRLQPRTDPDPYSWPGGLRPPPAGAGKANGNGNGNGGGPPVYWPVSEQVSNRMNVVTDHGGYWVNDEQVLLRLAAEVDAPYHRDSPFWRGDARLADGQSRTAALCRAVTDLRERVSVLAAMRAVVVVVALALVRARPAPPRDRPEWRTRAST